MFSRNRLSIIICLPLLLSWGATVEASSFIRAGLDDLTAQNESVWIAEVTDADSYWNVDGTFILTDVHLEVLEVLKGGKSAKKAAVTLMGGTVGDLSTVILGGANLIPGNSYVLFLSSGNLPGAEGVLTVQDHAQGTFDIQAAGGTLRAVSQASGEHLMADDEGKVMAPYGLEGIELERLAQEIRSLVLNQEENR